MSILSYKLKMQYMWLSMTNVSVISILSNDLKWNVKWM